MDSSLVSQEAKKRCSRNQVNRTWNRQDTVIFQSFGMTRREWRELPNNERKAFRLAWMAQQEETDTIKPTWTPGYVYVLRHPRYADLCKVGETVSPTRRLMNYNSACPYKQYRYHFMCRCADTRFVAHSFYDRFHESRLHGEWYDCPPETAANELRQIREELCN
jgi:hypothetical protein